MTSCQHRHLILLPPSTRRVRCRHCHLTIRADEIQGDPCPECLQETGVRRYDFEPVPEEKDPVVRYRCEDCGVIVQAGPGGA